MRGRKKREERALERAELERELRTAASIFAASPRGALVSFGAPTRCPSCSTFGMVDYVSQVRGIAKNHCMSCGERWELTRRAIEHLDWVTRQADQRIESNVPSRDAKPRTEVAAAFPDWAGPLADQTEGHEWLLDLPSFAMPTTTNWTGGLRVLLVEPDPFDMAMIETLVEPLGDQVALAQVSTIGAARRQLARGVDVVLIAARIVAGDGSAPVATWIQHVGQHAPVILLTDAADESTSGLARVLGAAQVVDNRQLGRLADDPGVGSKRLLQLLTITVKKHQDSTGVQFAW